MAEEIEDVADNDLLGDPEDDRESDGVEWIHSLDEILRFAGYRDVDLVDGPVAAAARCIEALEDGALHNAIRTARSADRKAFLELLRLPKGSTPSLIQMSRVREKFALIEDVELQAQTALHLARRPAERLEEEVRKRWTAPIPDHPDDAEVGDFGLAIAQAAAQLAADTTPAFARLAAYGLSIMWPRLDGMPFRTVALDSDIADPGLAPGEVDFEALHALLDELEIYAASTQQAVSELLRPRIAGRYPTNAIHARQEHFFLLEAGRPFVDFGVVLNRLARQRELAPLVSSATVAELRAHLETIELHDADTRSAEVLALRAEGVIGDAVAALVEASAHDAAAQAASEALAALVELVATTGDDELVDAAAERVSELLGGSSAWTSTGVSARMAVTATLRGRVTVALEHKPQSAISVGVPSDEAARDLGTPEGSLDRGVAPGGHGTEADPRRGEMSAGNAVAETAASVDDVDGETLAADVEDPDRRSAARVHDDEAVETDAGADTEDSVSAGSPLAEPTPKIADEDEAHDGSRSADEVTSDEAVANEPEPISEAAFDEPALSDGGEADAELDALEVYESAEVAAAYDDRAALASHAASAGGSSERADGYAALALAEALRTSSGDVAASLLPVLERLEEVALENRAAAVLTLAATLRAAIYSQSVEVLSSLGRLRAAFGHHAGTAELLDLAVQAGRAGTNISAASAALSRANELDLAVSAASAAAAAELKAGATKTNKYTAATVVWSTWIRNDGVLGRLLTIAASDDRSRLGEVTAQINELRDRGRLLTEIKAADPRGTKRNEIIAGARDRLLDWAESAMSCAATWVEAARAASAASNTGPAATGLLSRLREAARLSGTAELVGSTEGDAVTAAASRAASRSLARTLELYASGTDALSVESRPSHVMNDDLLLAPGPLIDADGPERPPSADELAAAVAADPSQVSSWEGAYAGRAERLDHDATARIVDRATLLDSGAGERLAAKRAVDVERAREAVRLEQRQVADVVASGRSHGHLDDGEWSALSGLVLSADPAGRTDLGRLQAVLAGVRAKLDEAREAAFSGLSERLTEARASGSVTPDDLKRVDERVAAGDIATAEEYLALALDGLALPSIPTPRNEFATWWPDLASLLSSAALDSRIVLAARAGKPFGDLDFGRLEPSVRSEAAAGLEAWMTLSGGRPRGQLIETARPLLSLLGIEASELSGLPGEKANADREWRHIVGFKRTGRALVPDFGTQSSGAAAGDTLLCLLVWNAPRAGTVASWLVQEASSRPVMVWYFGSMDPAERVALADEVRAARHRRPIIVIDDAVVAFIAAAGGRDYETLMRLTLPFAAVNPYQSVGGLTPVEMFYGREAERASLRNPTGSALVYGGRQLGKSSLLRATGRDFDDGHHRRALYLDLKANGIGTTRSPDSIWDLLWRSLAGIEVLTGEPPDSQIRTKLQERLIRWLDGSPGRALLILLDECDLFLAADAESRFDTVDALDDLMFEAGRRVKFVFAGLHRVQRFKSVENQPLAHLGAPIAVGPLRAGEAMGLVYKPLEALGYRFEHDELPARILAFCNNNPGLIVLFMQALIDRMLDSPLRRPGAARPPVLITDADVEATYAKGSLAELIKERFELTLDLDPAYKVIAYAVAHEAREQGEGLELSVRELRELASGWWAKGFADIGFDGFRALCDELVDLGVLANRSGAYGLRSPNILRFLGSAEQIAEVLIEAEHLRPSETFDSSSARPALAPGDGRRSPLTAAQLADVVAPRNQVRLVLGCELSGIDRVADAIRTAAGAQATVDSAEAAITKLSSFRNTAGRHRVLLIDLRDVDSARASRLVEEAVTSRRPATGTLGITFLADPRHHAVWRSAVGGEDFWERVGVVEAGRVDAAAWRYWISEAELPFTDDASATDMLAGSGGWLALLEEVAAAGRAKGRRHAAEVLDRIAEPGQANTLLAKAGLDRDRPLLHVFRAVCDYCPDGGDAAIVTEAAALAGGDATDVEVLRVLGAIDVEPSGFFRPESVLATAVSVPST